MTSKHGESEIKVKVKKVRAPPSEVKKKQSKRTSKLNKLASLRFIPANLKEGQKISKKNLMSLFPHDPEIAKYYSEKGHVVKNISELLVDKNYTIKTANKTRGGFKRYIAKSERVKVTWVEGPVPNMRKKYHISYPHVIRLDW